MKKLSAGAVALVLLLSAPLWGDPVAHSATSLSKSVKRALGLAKKADKRSKTALRRANAALARRGPTGPAGAPGVSGLPGKDGATGPTGPAGADGADGASGATGPTGATGSFDGAFTERSSETVAVGTPAGSTATAFAVCQAGETVVGGGYRLTNTPDDVVVIASRPDVAINGHQAWSATALRTANGAASNLFAYAICAS